jgi:Ras-related protein Rab-21
VDVCLEKGTFASLTRDLRLTFFYKKIIGDMSDVMKGRVGKTSILVRYVDDTYEEGTASTLQASFMEKTLKVGPASERQLVNGGKTETAKLSIWDTAGQERFHALGPIYYRDANGAVLVYDVTDKQSFERVKMWTKELRTMVGEEDRISIAIVGNKLDLIASGRTSRRVSTEDAMEYAKSVGAIHVDASAKEGTGVQDAFLQLTRSKSKNRSHNLVQKQISYESATIM